MLSARAYSFHQKSKLAISLSWIGGYANVVTLLTCGWVASHMTGPTTWFGRVLVEGQARIAKLIAAAFEDHDKPAPPSNVKVADGRVTWTASPDKNVLGYEVRDPEEDATLTFSTTTEAKLPEGHTNAWVYTRDTYGNRSKAAKPGE